MGFSRENQFSEKERVVNSGTKTASKRSNSFDQSKNVSGVKIPGKDQLVHQKNSKVFTSQKMIKFTKSDQKIEDGSNSGYTQRTNKASPKKQVASKGGDCSKLRKNLRVKEARFDRLHQKKPAAVYPEPEPERKGIDIEDQLSLFDRLSEDSDCMWLSSDSLSSSFLRSNASKDTWELDCLDQFLQRQLTSLSSSSSSGNYTSFNEDNESVDADRSKSFPVSETSLFLAGNLVVVRKMWRNSYPRSHLGFKDKNVQFKSPNSYQRALPEDRSASNRAMTLLSSTFPSSLRAEHHQMMIHSSRSCFLDSVGHEYNKFHNIEAALNEPLFWPLDSNLYSAWISRSSCACLLSMKAILELQDSVIKKKVTRLKPTHQKSPQVNKNDTPRLSICSNTKSVTTASKKCVDNGATTSALPRLSSAKSLEHNISAGSPRKEEGLSQRQLLGDIIVALAS